MLRFRFPRRDCMQKLPTKNVSMHAASAPTCLERFRGFLVATCHSTEQPREQSSLVAFPGPGYKRCPDVRAAPTDTLLPALWSLGAILPAFPGKEAPQ